MSYWVEIQELKSRGHGFDFRLVQGSPHSFPIFLYKITYLRKLCLSRRGISTHDVKDFFLDGPLFLYFRLFNYTIGRYIFADDGV